MPRYKTVPKIHVNCIPLDFERFIARASKHIPSEIRPVPQRQAIYDLITAEIYKDYESDSANFDLDASITSHINPRVSRAARVKLARCIRAGVVFTKKDRDGWKLTKYCCDVLHWFKIRDSRATEPCRSIIERYSGIY